METHNIIGIIPARYASTRFPGKPLVDIGGKSMIQRVYEQSRKALEFVYVATDDDRIAQAVEKFGGKYIMTSANHQSGTDRCSEAIRKISGIEEKKKFDVVINIQGDEPFIKPEQLRLLCGCFDDECVQIATLAKKISNTEQLFDQNSVKLVKDCNDFAIYFSRWPIPFQRGVDHSEWLNNHQYLKHLGIYAYKTNILKELTALKQTSLEKTESLEQNRWLENSYKIYVQTTDFENIAIDTPEDLEKVKAMNWE